MAALFPDYECVSREVDESLPEDTAPVRGVELLARRKGEAVAAMYRGDPGTVIISADTLVDLDGRKLGKPMSRGRRHIRCSARSPGGVTSFIPELPFPSGALRTPARTPRRYTSVS